MTDIQRTQRRTHTAPAARTPQRSPARSPVVQRAQAEASKVVKESKDLPTFARRILESFAAAKDDVEYQRTFASLLVREDQRKPGELAQHLVRAEDPGQRAEGMRAYSQLLTSSDPDAQNFLFQTLGGALAEQPAARIESTLAELKTSGMDAQVLKALEQGLRVPERKKAAQQVATQLSQLVSEAGVDPSKIKEASGENTAKAILALAGLARASPGISVELQAQPQALELIQRAISLSTHKDEHQPALINGLVTLIEGGDPAWSQQLSGQLAAHLVAKNKKHPLNEGDFGARLEDVIRRSGAGATLAMQLEKQLREGVGDVQPNGDAARQSAEVLQRALTDLMARAEGEKPPLEGEGVLPPLDALRQALPAVAEAASLYDSQHADLSRTAIGVLTGLPTLVEGKQGHALLRRELAAGGDSTLVQMLTKPEQFALPAWDAGQKKKIRTEVSAALAEAERAAQAKKTDPSEPKLADVRKGAQLILGKSAATAADGSPRIDDRTDPPSDVKALLAKHTLLKVGSRGPEVRELQTLLKKLGANPGGVDGVFGPKTRAAVVSLQRSKKLKSDGMVGQQTWATLLGFDGVGPGTALLKK